MRHPDDAVTPTPAKRISSNLTSIVTFNMKVENSKRNVVKLWLQVTNARDQVPSKYEESSRRFVLRISYHNVYFLSLFHYFRSFSFLKYLLNLSIIWPKCFIESSVLIHDCMISENMNIKKIQYSF